MQAKLKETCAEFPRAFSVMEGKMVVDPVKADEVRLQFVNHQQLVGPKEAILVAKAVLMEKLNGEDQKYKVVLKEKAL